MRILHTSDWHVGRTIRGRSRAAEHEAVLAEITRIAAAEAVDVVLVAGDQFDSAAPAPDAERIVWRGLLQLAATGAQVVVVAGNHDHAERLGAVAPLLRGSHITAGARLARPHEGGVVDIVARSGETARVALVPFVSQRGIVRADELMALDADQHAGRYAERVRLVLERLCAGFSADTVNVVVAHLMAAGGMLGGGERTAHTIFDYCVPATAFPAAAHYVALGHLHRAQQVPAGAPVWYCGSPLQLDFGEVADDKAVLLVEASPGAPARVRSVPLRAGRRLRRLRGTLEQLEALAGSTGDDHVQVVVEGRARAGLADEVRSWFPEAVDVRLDSAQPAGGPPRPRRLGRSPRELFGEYLAERDAADERVLALFDELFDTATTGEAAR